MVTEISITLAWSPSTGAIYARELKVPIGSTVQDALNAAHAMKLALPADWQACKLGIYGKHKPRDTVLRDKDRIELHRALIADPKEARRLRAKTHPLKKKQKSG